MPQLQETIFICSLPSQSQQLQTFPVCSGNLPTLANCEDEKKCLVRVSNRCHFLGVYFQLQFSCEPTASFPFLGVYLHPFQPPIAEVRQGTMLWNQDYHERCGLREATAGEEVVGGCVAKLYRLSNVRKALVQRIALVQRM